MIWLIRLLATQSFLASVVRHGLTAAGTALMTNPALHSGGLAQAFVGGALTAAGLGWSAANKGLNPAG